MSDVQVYEDCLRKFGETCGQLGDRVESILLYGSIARGEVRPGRSDVLDAVVVLYDEALQDERQFYDSLEVLIAACEDVLATNLPFHPFHYFSKTESRRAYWAHFLPVWRSDRHSRVLAGNDIRPYIRSVDSDRQFTRATFFSCRRSIQRMSEFLTGEPLTQDASRLALHAVGWFLKAVPKYACLVCGIEEEYPETLTSLAALFPDLEACRFEALKAQLQEETADLEPAEVLLMVRNVLGLYEELHDSVVAWLRMNGEWDRLRGNSTPVTVDQTRSANP